MPRRSQPEDHDRCEDDLDLPFGAVVHDGTGRAWAFVGWRVNAAGRSPLFACDQTGLWRDPPYPTYTAAHTATLMRKFPDVVGYRRSRTE